MVIGGAGSIVGSILGGAYYVLIPELTNLIDPSLTALLQGAILLVVLFLLPGGLASLPRALTRGRRRSRAEPGPAAPDTTPSSTARSGTTAEEPETERQGHA
jgi:branched-chain amino acid transport system permease protein